MMTTNRFPKLKHSLAAAMLLVTALFCMTLLASCGSDSDLEQIVVEGYREDFFVGDRFETGADFAVYAVYTDGHRENVTDKAEISQENGMDMNTVGDYMITVSYQEKKCVYTVYVNGSDSVLQKLTVDISDMKVGYLLGETISFDGIRLTAKYRNTQGRDIEIVYSDLSDFEISIQTSSGKTVDSAFAELGKHTVTLSKGDVSTSFDVNVEGVDLHAMQSVLNAAKYGFRFVNAGSVDVKETAATGSSNTTKYRFTLGNNYTYIKEQLENAGDFDYMKEYHFSLDEDTGKLLSVTLEDGKIVPGNSYVADAMNGAPIYLWYYDGTEYGVEAALGNLYAIGSADPNHDYTESIDAEGKSYSFSFGYLQKRIAGDDYYFVSKVSFVLNDDYSIASATLSQKLFTSGFQTDGNGHTSVNEKSFSYEIEVTLQQTSGERTAVNPYSGDSMTAKDFDLMLDGSILTEDDVIFGNAGTDLTLRITNIMPSTASFGVDLMYFSDGVSKPENVIFVCSGFTVYKNSATSEVINLHLSAGGEWELVITTEKVTKKVKISVTGVAPEKLTTEVYNPVFESFSKGTSVTPMVGASVYFRATPNQYANGAYGAVLSVGNANDVQLKKTEIGGVECWMFTASAAGTYEVLMTSSVAENVTCKLILNVVDVPDLGDWLKGKYQVTDTEGGVYDLTFTQSGDLTAVSGTLEVTYTSADGQSKTQTLKFTTSSNDLVMTLEPVSGDLLGISLKINAQGKLVLEDRYGVNYILKA